MSALDVIPIFQIRAIQFRRQFAASFARPISTMLRPYGPGPSGGIAKDFARHALSIDVVARIVQLARILDLPDNVQISHGIVDGVPRLVGNHSLRRGGAEIGGEQDGAERAALTALAHMSTRVMADLSRHGGPHFTNQTRCQNGDLVRRKSHIRAADRPSSSHCFSHQRVTVHRDGQGFSESARRSHFRLRGCGLVVIDESSLRFLRKR